MKRIWLLTAAGLLAASAIAEVVPVAPIDDEIVVMLTKEQLEMFAQPDHESRVKLFKADRAEGAKKYGTWRDEKKWNASVPFRFKWKVTANEKGPWKILVGKKADLSDARVLVTDWPSKPDKDGCWRFFPELFDPEVGETYYWQITSDIVKKKGVVSSVSKIVSFKTDPQPPRWIKIKGTTRNIRDLGGWMTKSGRRVRQGMAYRGEGLNRNSIDGGMTPGANRLWVEDVKYLTQTLGIRTDLELRSKEETAGMTESPLGAGVKFVFHPSVVYSDLFKPHGMEMTAKNFRIFCDEKNYPIYFHCIGGADRTGSLAYILNGVLGVDVEDLNRDYESTFYPTPVELESNYKSRETYWRGEWHFETGFAKYGNKDSSWNERIVLYLKECGITKNEIKKFREIMLEGK